MAKGETYEEFTEKFKPKKTTDDCYTPPNVYDAVADWVAQRYGLSRDDFVRPFYPGGNYENFSYPENCTVVDNPPFSLLAKIIDFYEKRNIRFFLFSPTLTLFSKKATDFTCLPIGCDITYENGAVVPTSFVTSLEDKSIVVHTYPDLYKAVHEANKENMKTLHKTLPKYSYPDNVLSAAMAYRYSQYGVEFILHQNECVKISALDSQKERGKKSSIFGKGFLISDDAASRKRTAERLAAERLVAERWQLSERELKIIEELSSKKPN